MDPERETKFRSAFGELRPWVDASLTVAKALLTQSRHYYCLGRGPTKGGELPVSLPSAGVLIRALEPLEGIPIMRLNRGIERLRDLARGPGRLTVRASNTVVIFVWCELFERRLGVRVATATMR